MWGACSYGCDSLVSGPLLKKLFNIFMQANMVLNVHRNHKAYY